MSYLKLHLQNSNTHHEYWSLIGINNDMPGEYLTDIPRSRVLVIDNESDIRSTIASAIDSIGLEIVMADNGEHGLRFLEQNRPALVITDVLMPEMDGIELIRHIRRRDPTLPILAMSEGWGAGHPDLLDIVVRLGATAGLHKPFDAQGLLKAVKHCLTHAALAPTSPLWHC